MGASGWDDRCLRLTTVAGLAARRSVLLLFKNKGTTGRAQRNDAVLRKYYSTRGGEATHVEESAEDLGGIWARLSKELIRSWEEKGAPLDILLDLSACPRYFPLGLLASGFAAGIVRRATLIYNEAEYTDVQSADLFTAGSWEATNIPGFTGAFEPGRPRLYVLSLGFEGAKTLRFVNRADPDRVAILFPNPGYRSEYPERTWRQNHTLLSDYAVGNLDSPVVVSAPAGDAIQAWRALTERRVERFGNENIYYLCCGTKPHSLSLALRAIATGVGMLLYPKPSAHRESAIRPAPEFWRYTIEDRSLPRVAVEMA